MPTAASEQFARIVDGLCNAIAARGVGGRLTAALLVLLWGRLRRTALRVRRLADRLASGPLVTRRRPASPRPNRPPPPHLPRGHAWLVRLVPGAAVFGSQLQHLLTDPEMAALADVPQMRRLLRPLCRMLGVATPPHRQPAVVPPPPPPASPPPPARPPARRAPAPAGQVPPTCAAAPAAA